MRIRKQILKRMRIINILKFTRFSTTGFDLGWEIFNFEMLIVTKNNRSIDTSVNHAEHVTRYISFEEVETEEDFEEEMEATNSQRTFFSVQQKASKTIYFFIFSRKVKFS